VKTSRVGVGTHETRVCMVERGTRARGAVDESTRKVAVERTQIGVRVAQRAARLNPVGAGGIHACSARTRSGRLLWGVGMSMRGSGVDRLIVIARCLVATSTGSNAQDGHEGGRQTHELGDAWRGQRVC
jgi:hypothetical protein